MRMEEEVLVMETMSSEDSCYEADEDGKEALTVIRSKSSLGRAQLCEKSKSSLIKSITRGRLRGHVTGLCLELYGAVRT